MHLHDKSSKVCIKTRSTPASLSSKGQVTEQTTVKRCIHISFFFTGLLWCYAFLKKPLVLYTTFELTTCNEFENTIWLSHQKNNDIKRHNDITAMSKCEHRQKSIRFFSPMSLCCYYVIMSGSSHYEQNDINVVMSLVWTTGGTTVEKSEWFFTPRHPPQFLFVCTVTAEEDLCPLTWS